MSNLVEKVEKSKKIIEVALNTFPNVAVSVSFGKDSVVVLRLALEIHPDINVFTVMTHFKPKETFEYKDMMHGLWGFNLEEYMSPTVLSPDMPLKDPDECCRILKVEPTKKALKPLDGWITGLRKTEGRTRTDYEHVEISYKKDFIEGWKNDATIAKINPILEWTELDIWKYMAIMSIPPHPWYSLGYRSIGCASCTHLIDDEQEERAGRWVGTSKCGGECGIHTMHKG